jgi:hypothetical protein
MADKETPAVAGEDKASEPAGPASAPELTDEQRQKIEADLSVETGPAAEPIELRSKPNDPSESEVEPDQPSVSAEPLNAEQNNKPHANKLRRFFAGYWHRGWWTIPLTLLVALAILTAVPFTRYKLAGYVISQQVKVAVSDNSTQKPVTSADVLLDGKTYKTDKEGVATIAKVKPGKHTLKVSKKYYKDASADLAVPLNKGITQKVGVTATGRQVPVSVINKISGKPLSDVTLKASGTEVKTDKDGKAVMVLPADRPDLPITLAANNYNQLEARIIVTDAEVKANTFAIVPSGKVYFLSKASGKIDVVKTDLDGGNRQTVVQGTGKEDEANTVLLASRDWKYLGLQSRRETGLAKLYVIDTSTDKMAEMDSGNAAFQLVGWSDHHFVYRVDRNNVKDWEPNRTAFKSFDADKRQILTIDQTSAEGDQNSGLSQRFDAGYLVDGQLVYHVGWNAVGSAYSNGSYSGKSHILRTASVTTVGHKDVRSWPNSEVGDVQIVPYEPGGLYVQTYLFNGPSKFYEYEDSALKDADIDQAKFYSSYATYLASPDGKQTFWNEGRDGKPTFFVGDDKGQNGKQVAVLDDSQVYGWYGNDYLLTSKKGSELYIMPAAGGTPLKITDYHKPQISYQGYGGGYGGL